MKRETHSDAYDFMLKRGWSSKELEELSESQVIGSWEENEYSEGRIKGEHTNFIYNESGDLTDMIDYCGYIGESYDDAVTREATEADDMLNTLIED